MPRDSKDAMPKDNKTPLSPEQVKVIAWWIQAGAPRSGTVAELKPPAELMPLIEAEYARLRRGEGRTTTGVKVGFANRAMWRALKLDTLVWAHMFDDTVHAARGGEATLSIDRMRAPKIEPEIVFKLKRPLTDPDLVDPLRTLDAAAVERIAVMPIPAHGLGEAINDRLKRAASAETIPVGADLP